MTAPTRTGREYLRVSMDRSGRARSVDEQHGDNDRAATERGVTLRTPYRDNSVSASRYTSKTRDDFAKLIDDLGKGRFGAEELWLWEPSRGSRRVGEWVELIEACEGAGVSIYVTTHGRAYDPSNGRDRRSLLEDAVDSEYESSKVSARGRRAAAANAAAGRPHGPTPFGYRRIYDPETRKLVRQEPHPDEAPVIRELFTRLQQGHSLRSIAADFDTREVRTRTGKAFSPNHLRSLALTPSYVGLRVHDPTARKEGRRLHDRLDGAVKGVWEPLVDEATFYAVRQLLTRPERVTTRPGRARHLLSMIARCHECGAPLAVTRRSDGKGRPAGVEQYQCHKRGCVRVDKAALDAIAEDAIFHFLASEDWHHAVTMADTDEGAARGVRNALAAARSELEDLRAGVAEGRLSVANLISVEPGLIARVEALEAEERGLSTPSALHGLLDPSRDVHTWWRDAAISTQREVVRLVFTPDLLGELQVARRPDRSGSRHVPAVDRVRWHKR